MKQELITIKALFKKIRNRKDIRIFRNNVGLGYNGKVISINPVQVTINNYRKIKFGLIKGSGDYIGWKTITITQDMVGNKIAQFVSIETKKNKGIRSYEQVNWCDVVNRSGGIGLFVDDPQNIEI